MYNVLLAVNRTVRRKDVFYSAIYKSKKQAKKFLIFFGPYDIVEENV